MWDQVLKSHFLNSMSSTEMNCSVSNEYCMYDLTSAITVPLFTSNNGPMLLFKSCKFISIYCFFDTSSLINLAQNVILLFKLWKILPCAVG